MNPLVSVIVVTYNGRSLLGDCLESLRAQTYPHREVVVVDNGSRDGTVEWVRGRYPEAHLVPLDDNRGFAGGCNAGLAVASGELVATLNNDAVAHPDWLARMVEAIQSQSDVGMVAPRVLFAASPDVVESAGICVDRAGIAWDRLGGRPDRDADEGQEVFGPSAGAALYRRALFDDVGGFDEDFFLYLEDVDLAWRARFAGWRCVYVPEARVYHRHSATAGEDSPFKRFHLSRNRVWLLAKNYPAPEVWFYLPAILAYDVGMLVAALDPAHLVGGSVAARVATVHGRLAGLLTVGRALAKRRAIQRRRRIPRRRLLAAMQPFAWPWEIRARYAHLPRMSRRSTELVNAR